MKIQLTQREYNTVLAALRQRMQALDGNPLPVEEFETIAADDGDALNAEEIDELCERMQSGEGATP